MRLTLAVVAVALATFLLPGVVLAHADLVTASPADKAVVTEPVAEVFGIYAEAMTSEGSSLVIRDATGNVVARGAVDPADPMRMVAVPAVPLGNGTYTVGSSARSVDTHVERTSWTFTVAVAPSPSPAPTAQPSASATAATTAAPETPSPSPSLVPSPTATPSGGGGLAGSGGDVLLPIVVAVIILGAGTAYLLSRRNRPTHLT